MTTFSLREAAEQTGTSKSTIFRAIRAGRLSAARDSDGNFAIDPSELFRVYPPKGEDVAPERSEKRPEGHGATAFDTTELRVRNAQMDAELRALRLLLEASQKREDDIRVERDRWSAQAERLSLSGPQAVPAQSSVPQVRGWPQRSWWPWRRSA